MFQVVVSVMDRAVNAFSRPFFAPTAAAAIRSFSDEVNRRAADNQMNAHPEDFDLYSLGRFEDSTGMFEGTPELLIRGKDCLQKDN